LAAVKKRRVSERTNANLPEADSGVNQRELTSGLRHAELRLSVQLGRWLLRVPTGAALERLFGRVTESREDLRCLHSHDLASHRRGHWKSTWWSAVVCGLLQTAETRRSGSKPSANASRSRSRTL